MIYRKIKEAKWMGYVSGGREEWWVVFQCDHVEYKRFLDNTGVPGKAECTNCTESSKEIKEMSRKTAYASRGFQVLNCPKCDSNQIEFKRYSDGSGTVTCASCLFTLSNYGGFIAAIDQWNSEKRTPKKSSKLAEVASLLRKAITELEREITK